MSELEIWNELGNIYYNAGAYDEAIRAYHRAIELGHCSGQSFCNLADIYIRKGFFGEAILMYQKGIEDLKLSVDQASLWNRLADVYLQLDRYDEAIKAYQTAVELDPENEELREDLARVVLASNHQSQALDLPQASESVEPPAGEASPSQAEAASAPVPALEPALPPAVEEPFCLAPAAEPTPAFFPEDASAEAAMGSAAAPEAAMPLEMSEELLPVEGLEQPAWQAEEDVVGYIPDPAVEIEALWEKVVSLETAGPATDSDLWDEPASQKEVEAGEAFTDPALEIEAFLEEAFVPEAEEPLVSAELVDESAWLRLENISGSIPDTATETVEETAAEAFPPLPEEFRAEEDLELSATTGEPAALENEMETEAALRVAAFLSDLPEIDSVSPELESPCWVFQGADTPESVEMEAYADVDKDPLVLGSRLLSEEAEFSPVMQSLEQAPVEALATVDSQSEELLSNLEQETASSSAGPDFNELLASALPANFEIPFRWEQPDKALPLIQPRMGEPMNSRAGALVRVGLRHWHQNDYEGAVQFLTTALNLAGVFFDHPFEALCYNALALVETDMGNTDEAIRAYENAACLAPEEIHPWKEIGFLYSKNSRYEEALESFKKAIEHSPNDPLTWNGLGDVYHKLGHTEDAISAYQLGNVFDRSGRETADLQPAPKTFEAAEVNPRVLEEMGNISFLNSEYDDAIHAYSDAIELLENPTDKARLWRRLGDAYHRLNEEDNAKAACQQALDLDSAALPLQNSPCVSEPISASHSFEAAAPVTAEALPEAMDEPVTAVPETAEFPELEEAVMMEPDNSTLPDTDEAERASTEPAGRREPELPEPDEPALQPDSSEPVVVIEEQSVEPAPVEADPRESEPFSPPCEPVLEPEPEAAYWFYKSNDPVRPQPQPVREATRPVPGFKLSADTGLGAVKPSPAFVLPKYSDQARLDKPLVSEAFADPTIMVMEDTPGNENSAQLGSMESSVLVEEETRPISIADLDALWDEEQDADRMEGNAVEESQPASSPEATPGADAHTLENDIVAYRRVTEINPHNDRAWDALGNMYEATGLHSEAIAAFEKAISLASQREVYHYHLGLAYAAQNRYDKAIQCLQKVVALNPDYVLAHCALAGYYRRTGKEGEAREHMVIARPYMESENYYNQACFESICGNTDRAFAFLKNALEKKQVEIELARTDADLDFIRQDPRFEAVLNQKDAVYQVTP